MRALTPEFLAKAEDEMNASLARVSPALRVCLHPDRTARYTGDRSAAVAVECDYCPAAAVGPDYAVLPALAPWHYTDPALDPGRPG